jgi:hypothetical protein
MFQRIGFVRVAGRVNQPLKWWLPEVQPVGNGSEEIK